MNDTTIVDKVIQALKSIPKARVISSNDFSEERTNNMIVIGIEEIEQVNVALPDYKYKMLIVLDTFIEGDKRGKLFHETKSAVMDILNKFIYRELPLSQLFGDLPVVGFIQESDVISLDENSNRCEIGYQIYTSE